MAYDAEVCLWGVGGDDSIGIYAVRVAEARQCTSREVEDSFQNNVRFFNRCCVRTGNSFSDPRVSLWGQHGSCNAVDRGLLLCRKIDISPSVLRRSGATFQDTKIT